MLIVTRKPNESLVIGGDPPLAVVTILGVRGRKVRLGIEADRLLPVNRIEMYEKKYGKKPSTGLFRPPQP